jgi:16S rRNA (cytosine967-C5)-methyltransferase
VHFKPLINAVLRRVSREGAAHVARQDAAQLNIADWLRQRWTETYGESVTREIAHTLAQIPPLDLTCKTPEDAADFPPEAQLVPAHVRLRDAGRVDSLPGFREGRWWVQDFAASLPARLFGTVAGKAAIDLCAAPGGKTAQLAAAGADVTAIDIAPERLEVVRENLERLQLSATTVVADAREWRPPAPADCVLLDAPCTATGTIRRHPDLPWVKSAADVPALESLQAELLEAAADMAKPGGTLVYAVCSLESEEGVEQIEHFLRSRTDFRRAPVTADEVYDARFITPAGDIRTLPCHWAEKGGMDGFYAARLKRGA